MMRICAAILIALCPVAVTSSAAAQDTLIGVVGRDFIVLGADSSSSSSVALTCSELDKITVLSDPFPIGRQKDETTLAINEADQSWEQQTIVAAAAGDSADADRLLGVLAAHCAVREYEAGIGCDVETVYDGSSGYPSSLQQSSLSASSESAPLSLGTTSSIVSAPSGLDAEAVAHLARGEIATSLRSRGHLKVCLLIAGMVRADPSCWRDNDVRETSNDDRGNDGESIEYSQDDSTLFSARIRRQVEAATSNVGSSTRFSTPIVKDDDMNANTQRQRETYSQLVPRMFWLDEYGSIQRLEYGTHGYASNFALSILDRGYHPNMTREEAAALVRDCFDQLRTRYVINSPNPPCIKCVDSDGCRIV